MTVVYCLVELLLYILVFTVAEAFTAVLVFCSVVFLALTRGVVLSWGLEVFGLPLMVIPW